MDFHVLTLFPQMLEPYFKESILGKACERGLIRVIPHQLRDYAIDKHKVTDDRPFGGGSGMVLKVDVVVNAVRDIKRKYSMDRVILLSPRGELFLSQKALHLSKFKSILLICGRYEGVDQRAIELVVDEELSIGDYILTGGELPAQIVIDAVSRYIPGVIGNEEAPTEESHQDGLLEYPHYTRPQLFEGREVPKVLLSGHHEEIAKWRREESLKITKKNRPDLIKKLK